MENTVTNGKGNEVTSSSDCPTDEQVDGNSSLTATFPSAGVTSTSDDIESSNLVFEQCTGNGFVTSESASGMLSHESFGSSVPQEKEEQEVEDGDSSLSPLSWVHRQMSSGTDPRLILAELLPKGAFVPHNVNDGLLWRFIVNLLSEPKRTKLDHINTLDDATRLLRTCKNVIVLTGAGVSVSCGIPDFRSRNGIYARLSKDYPDLPDPQAMFDIRYFRRDPRPFFKFAKEIYPGQFSPSPSHKFIKLLERQNKLLRNYSQNIDTLEHAAGIKNVITCHGSFATATCTICGYKVDSSVIKDDIFCQRIPHCPVCPAESLEERGIMKPDIVFFGEGLSDAFHEAMAVDKEVCDLLIVMGSSLKVRPVAMIPSSIPTNIPQILINREPLKHLTFDIELLGDCDVVIGELCRRLSSDWCMDDEQLQSPPLREIPVHPKGQAGATGAEVNNNGSPGSSHSSCPPPSEESNSCDCRGMSQIRLEDSQDGLREEDTPKRIPEGSYLFFPPSRYVFEGAEVDEDEDDDDPCSTPTDYSSDSDAAKEPVDRSSPRPEETETADPSEEKSWEETK